METLIKGRLRPQAHSVPTANRGVAPEDAALYESGPAVKLGTSHDFDPGQASRVVSPNVV